MILTMLATMLLTACCDDDKNIEFGSLPASAKSFVTEYFNDKKVATVFYENEIGDSEYEVVFTDGSKISFRKDGVWEEVTTRDSVGVPSAIIPTAINDYVAANNSGMRIIKISKEYKGFKVMGLGKEDTYYEIELNNDLEMLFDVKGNLIRYDD